MTRSWNFRHVSVHVDKDLHQFKRHLLIVFLNFTFLFKYVMFFILLPVASSFSKPFSFHAEETLLLRICMYAHLIIIVIFTILEKIRNHSLPFPCIHTLVASLTAHMHMVQAFIAVQIFAIFLFGVIKFLKINIFNEIHGYYGITV